MKTLKLGIGLVSIIAFINISCTGSKLVPSRQSSITALSEEIASDEPTIFLLERDIPATIHKLGIVNISIGVGGDVDQSVKRELKLRCQQLKANGAYRINDGFYPTISRISYLVFLYKK